MRLLDGTLILSPSDLSKFVRCAHATTLDLAELRGDLARLADKRRSLHTDFIVRKGSEFEHDYIEELAAAGNNVLHIQSERRTRDDLVKAEADTLDAMRACIDCIDQAVFFDGNWVGYADLLQKVPIPSVLGNGASRRRWGAGRQRGRRARSKPGPRAGDALALGSRCGLLSSLPPRPGERWVGGGASRPGRERRCAAPTREWLEWPTVP